MKNLFLSAVLLVSSLAAAWADPKGEFLSAIKKLGEQSGYGWTFDQKSEGTSSGRQQNPIEGRTEKGGFTYLKGTSGDITYEVALKGEKIIVNYAGDWISLNELGQNGRVARSLKALKRPTDEAEALSAKIATMKKESDGSYSGELTDETAKEIFAQIGKRAAEAPEAKGTVQAWIKDGLLSKYVITVKGKITAGEDKREVNISRTTTVEIKNVGAVKITLPDDARKKLE